MQLDMFFEVTGWRGEPVNNEPHKCDELRWAALDAMSKNTVPEVAFA